MKKTRSIVIGALALSAVVVLVAGCYRPAAPEVTGLPAGGTEAVEAEETPDLEATAIANATLAAQAAEEEAEAEAAEPTATPSEPTLAPTPTPMPPPTTPPPTPEPPAPTPEPAPSGQTTHVVRPGENLFRIALRYGTTVQAIAEANGIADPRRIYVGQELTIPSAGAPPSAPAAEPSAPTAGETTYVVQPGDNLFRIALRYNMSHLYLAQYNGISNPSNIYVGQVLRIPPR